MDNRQIKNRKISPEEAVRILAQSGMEVSIEEAKNILELLYIFAKLEVDHYVTQRE
ncbi:hypothetical protein [Mucilaginibacter sp. MD40]|uniref:hypothetical protein n=1 Tax=Mucilaginibacter sp. MD40 TaxID=2029590 RepID=UPI0018E922B6|nr:hypothetical protein [Mucilaginibacter sp. MD40]